MEREREKGDKPTAKPTVRSSDDVIPLAPSSLRLVVVDVEGWLNDEDEGCINLVCSRSLLSEGQQLAYQQEQLNTSTEKRLL